MKTTLPETRECRLCGEEKALNLFENDKRVTNGVTHRCKKCKASLNDRGNVLLANMRRRAAVHGAEVDITREQINTLYEAFDGRCTYCGKVEDGEGVRHSVDHVVPVSRGGTSHISNLLLSCISCNSSKGNKPVATFYVDRKETGHFPGENFLVVEQFLALMSGTPIKEMRSALLQEHAEYVTGRMFERMDEQAGFI